MLIKSVLFDLDNTLYDYDKAHKIAIKAVYTELQKHMKLSYSDFLRLFKLSRTEIHRELAGTASAHNRILYFQRLIEKTHNTVEPSIILKLYDAYWNTLLNNMELRKGALDVLKYCKDNQIKTAIVSDLTTKIQLRKLEKLRISRYVDVLVTSEEAGSEKPHSIMFLLTLNKLGTTPQNSIMVGDNTIADIEGANFVGLTTVLIKRGSMARIAAANYQKPDFSIKNIKDLTKIIDEINLKRVTEEGYIKYECHFNKSRPIPKEKIKKINSYRQKLYDLRLIGAYPNKIGYGNISIKDKKKIIITGSTTGNYRRLDETHYGLVDKYDIHKNKLFCSGTIKASSESMTHAAIYECDKSIGAVIHIHNMKMWKKYLHKLPTTDKNTSYGTPELAFEIQRLYHDTEFKNIKIAVLGGHKEGIIAFGKDLEEGYRIILKYFNDIAH